MYFLTFLLFIIFHKNISVALKMQPKFCINCKHFIEHDLKDEYGKCALYPVHDSKFLVTGKNSETDYLYCSTVRNASHMCGESAVKYKKKRTRKIIKE